MKKCKKALSLLLAVIMTLGVFSCSVTVFAEDYAEYAASEEYREKLLTETADSENEKAEIVWVRQGGKTEVRQGTVR